MPRALELIEANEGNLGMALADAILRAWLGGGQEVALEAVPPPAPKGGLKFVRPGKVNPGHGRPRLVEVDVAALDAAWRKDGTFYIAPSGASTVEGRYRQAKEFLTDAGKSKIGVEASVVSFDPATGRVSFADGRHRFAAMRDMGLDRVTVAVDTRGDPKGTFEAFRDQFRPTTPPASPPPYKPMGELFPDGDKPRIRFTKIEAAANDLAERRVVDQHEFRGLSQAAKNMAFNVGRGQTLDAISTIRGVLEETVREGASLDGFRDRLETALDGSKLGDWHMEVVYRTNVQQAFAEGQDHVLRHPLVSDEFPYVAYFSIADDRRRHEHGEMERLGLDGTNVYRRNDPVIRKFRPPWSWNCRCHLVALTLEQAAALGVREAKVWLQSGIPPERPQFVRHPPFDLPDGWVSQHSGGFA